MSLEKQVAAALLDIGAVGFSLQEPVTFKSGIISPVYVDNRRLPFHPEQWQVVIEGFKQFLDESTIVYDIIAGVAVGGVPHSSALGYAMHKPSVFIRKEAKEHGKRKLVEGGDVEQKRVLLVEDLVTTGGSSLAAVSSLRAEGAIVDDMLAIVSYGFTQANTAFNGAKVQLNTLTNFTAVLDTVREQKLFGENDVRIIEDWFHDPHGWAERHGHG